MEVQKILEKDGFTGKVIYDPTQFNLAASKRYTLIIEKDGKELIHRSNMTGSGAAMWFYRWVDKKINGGKK